MMGLPEFDTQPLEIEINRSIASDFDSFVQEVKFFDMGSIQVVWTGANAATGVFTPQASLDKVNWCDLASGTALKKTTVGSGCALYLLPNIEYPWLRVRFTANTNSAGTVTIYTYMKRRRHV